METQIKSVTVICSDPSILATHYCNLVYYGYFAHGETRENDSIDTVKGGIQTVLEYVQDIAHDEGRRNGYNEDVKQGKVKDPNSYGDMEYYLVQKNTLQEFLEILDRDYDLIPFSLQWSCVRTKDPVITDKDGSELTLKTYSHDDHIVVTLIHRVKNSKACSEKYALIDKIEKDNVFRTLFYDAFESAECSPEWMISGVNSVKISISMTY